MRGGGSQEGRVAAGARALSVERAVMIGSSKERLEKEQAD